MSGDLKERVSHREVDRVLHQVGGGWVGVRLDVAGAAAAIISIRSVVACPGGRGRRKPLTSSPGLPVTRGDARSKCSWTEPGVRHKAAMVSHVYVHGHPLPRGLNPQETGSPKGIPRSHRSKPHTESHCARDTGSCCDILLITVGLFKKEARCDDEQSGEAAARKHRVNLLRP